MSEASYKKLLSYRFSLITFDLTVKFCNKFLLSKIGNLSNLGGRPDYRTSDQMIQAARSGKQNIVEGSQAMQTSLKSAIKLTNVAKASIEELLEDYEDFLRQREFPVWSKSDKRVFDYREKTKKLANENNLSILSNLSSLRNPEEFANLMLTLCHQTSFLLARQVAKMEEKHTKEGGYSEKLYNMRKKFRGY